MDEGGPKRELFQLLKAILFEQGYGLFKYVKETGVYWINHQSLEGNIQYELIGTLLGLSIYNKIILGVNFPHLLYKKLLNISPTFEDLKQIQPSLYSGFILFLFYFCYILFYLFIYLFIFIFIIIFVFYLFIYSFIFLYFIHFFFFFIYFIIFLYFIYILFFFIFHFEND